MSFRHRRTTSRLINRRLQKYKHVIDAFFQNVNANAAIQSTTIAQGADNPIISQPTSVQARARITRIFFELNFFWNQAGTQEVIDYIIWFNPQQSLTTPNPAASGSSTAKAYIFNSGKFHIYGGYGHVPFKLMGVIRVPRKFQRLMNGDAIVFSFSTEVNNTASSNFSIRAIYKEIRG